MGFSLHPFRCRAPLLAELPPALACLLRKAAPTCWGGTGAAQAPQSPGLGSEAGGVPIQPAWGWGWGQEAEVRQGWLGEAESCGAVEGRGFTAGTRLARLRVGLERAARWGGEARATVLGSVPEDFPQLQEPSGSASARGMCSLVRIMQKPLLRKGRRLPHLISPSTFVRIR